LKRFEDEILDRTRAENDRLMQDWESASDEDVWRRATKKMIETRASEAFAKEFERQQLFYSVRDPEARDKRYFGSIAELDDLADNVRAQLQDAYTGLIVEPLEGKDSRASQSSSNSSDPSSVEEVSEASGLQAASA
jgi:hypothetical protein